MAALSKSGGANDYAVEVLGRRWLSEGTFELELSRPPHFDYEPGQRVRLHHGELERDYSLVSAPTESRLTLCIRRVVAGRLTPLLATVALGTQLRCSGPHGYFVFRPSPRPAVMVATGTGIAPFVSMAKTGVRCFALLHGVRDPGEFHYQSTVSAMTERYVPCLSAGQAGVDAPGGSFGGHVTEYLKEHLEAGVYDFYLCGRTEMIRDVTLLVDERFPGSYVFVEAFF